MPNDERWRQRAACRGLGPAAFYSEDPRREAAAQAVCARCPVVDACRDAGMSEDWGTWGGQTARERCAQRSTTRGPGPAPTATAERLWALLASADPSRPALDQVLARLPIASPTAYRYLAAARRMGLVERRNGRLYPVRRCDR